MSDRKAEEFFDEIAESYAAGVPEVPFDRFARSAISFADDITWHFITKYIPRDKSIRILDAGGGEGFWAQKLYELGYPNIVLLDISSGMLEQAKRRFSSVEGHNVTFIKSDIANMKEIDPMEFDFIFSQYDAVSLSMKPRESIRELARVAKRGCHIVLSMDTKFRRVSELIEARRIDDAEKLLNTNVSYDFQIPQYNLTWQELKEHFEACGLAVIEIVGAPVFMHQVDEKVLTSLEKDAITRERLLKMEMDYCTDKSLVNFAGHIQIIGKKSGSSRI
ncbi:MAG: class I SAM-dependent methyltransferase [Promethearchaeota archaeon]